MTKTITIQISFEEPAEDEDIKELTVKVDGKVLERDNTGVLRGVDDHYDIWSNYACAIALQYGESPF